ncbi:MAG: sulfatase [Gemmataceae bacterium]|nr:sulfatase [Gemmataceae bacterium]
MSISPAANRSGPVVVRPAPLLPLAVWFGLFSGLAEVGYWILVRLVGQSWYLRLPPDFPWMTPVTDVVVFLSVGLALAGLARAAPGLPWLRVGLFTFTALVLAKALLVYGKLHPLPLVLLACGAAVQVSRVSARYFARLWPVMSRSLMWMVHLTAALAATRLAAVEVAERRARAQLPAPPTGAPNVLFIVLDTVRAKNLSLYGYARQTSPQLERWAKKGVTFERAMATSSWTLPSHGSLFTGRYPDDLTGGWHTPLDATHPTLAEVLAGHGYLTAGFVANRFYAGKDSGLARGFVHYDDFANTVGEFINSSTLTKRLCGARQVRRVLGFDDLYGRRNAAEVSRAFLDWQARQTDRPFFAFLNYFDAHDPYLPPAPFDTKFGPALTRAQRELMTDWWPCHRLKLTGPQTALAMRAYDSCLAGLDHQVGLLLDELDRRGTLGNTLVIIASDHGEHFGEHGLMLHGNSLYRDLLRVPLVILYPGRIPAGGRVKSFVSLRDLPATVLDLAGLTWRGRFPGQSLTRHWESGTAGSAAAPVLCLVHDGGQNDPNEHRCSPVARGSMVSLFLDGKHYIRNLGDGREELYCFDGDPGEQNDLAGTPAGQALLPRYREAVARALAEE